MGYAIHHVSTQAFHDDPYNSSLVNFFKIIRVFDSIKCSLAFIFKKCENIRIRDLS